MTEMKEMLRTKEEAMIRIKNLLRTAQRITHEYDKNKKILVEVRDIAKDHEIGLELFEEQKIMLKNKESYEMIDKFLSDIINKYNIDETLNQIANEDSYIQNLVECIFLEKKLKDETDTKVLKEEEKRKKSEMVKKIVEKEEKPIIAEPIIKNEPKKAVQINVREENPIIEEIEAEPSASNVRIPFAWKNGNYFAGGTREKHREGSKHRKTPSKEYRGHYEKKSSKMGN